MKKLSAVFTAVLIVLLFIGSFTVSAYENNDNVLLLDTPEADFLTAPEEEELFRQMVSFSEATGWKVGVVATAKDYSDAGVVRAAESYFDDYFGVSADGVLLLMDSANGNYVIHILAANGARKYISDSDSVRIFDHIKRYFENYDELNTATTFLDDALRLRGGGSAPRNINTNIALTFLIAAAVLTIISGAVVWNRYHAHPKISATAYLNHSSLNIYSRSDRFIREFTTRTSNSSSSSGGGSRHHSGGGHHGGGGGRGHR
ncbi:MAG: TPM domain-containing protein [Ruminococcus sp.]|jgi:uncharacterized membrane protein YgcG|nr:TPM domain-containing protein [Ruminococcus sp.]